MGCPTCGLSVLWGGVKHNGKKYCSQKCFEEDAVNRIAETIPENEVENRVNEIHSGVCPLCGESGPIDVHKSYFIYSIILFTSYRTNLHLSCRSCARKEQLKYLFISALAGWWGIPFGILITPIMLLMGLVSLFITPNPGNPSKALVLMTRDIMAEEKFAITQSANECLE